MGRRSRKREVLPNPGYIVIQPGEATGISISSNLCTLSLLQGTDYLPPLTDTVLFIEEAKFSNPSQFDRNLQSLVQQRGFRIRGLVLGRFQKDAMTEQQLWHILQSKRNFEIFQLLQTQISAIPIQKLPFQLEGWLG